jgi:copper(I)-binding protein
MRCAIHRFTARRAGNASSVTAKSAGWRTAAGGAALSLCVVALCVVGCQNDAELDSSSRGENSKTTMTSVANAYIVPTFVPGACAIQYGDAAKIRFTATNNRDLEPERLLSITTDAADTVQVLPNSGSLIPPGSSITTGYPTGPGGTEASPLEATIDGLEDSVRPGVSVDVTFEFEKAGPIVVRTPVEACPAQSERMR